LPEGIEKIGNNAFEYLYHVKEVTLSNNLTSIGASAFAGYSAYNVNAIEITSLPESLTTVGEKAFYASSISITSLPKKITMLPAECFNRCANLRIDTFGSAEGDGLTSIGDRCFESSGGNTGSAIDRIYLYESVKKLGNACFSKYGSSAGPSYIYTTLPESDENRLSWDIKNICGNNNASINSWSGN